MRWGLGWVEHKSLCAFAGGAYYEETTMKLSTIALAGAFALTSTFALAQSSTSGGSMGTGSNMNGPAGTPGPGENPAGTGASGMKASGSMERGTTGTSKGMTDKNPTSPATTGVGQSTTK
jgi:hypothetical protein